MKKTSMLITLLLLLLWTSGPSQAQTYARHGMSPAAYQQIFDSLSNKGYRLSSISGYSPNGSVRYAAIWKKQGGPALVARHGLSSAAYQESFDDLSGKGYKLKTVSGYAGGNHALFAAIWTKNQGTQWAARHNMTGDDYQATFNDMYKKGYNLTQVSGYVVNGSIYFAAIWEKDNRKIAAHHNMTSSQYQDYFNDYGSKGYQLQNVSGYEKNGQNLYAAVWEKKSAPLTYARHGMSPINYQHNFDNCYYQGYEPVYINGFAADGGSRFNAIWENKNISYADMKTMDDEVNAYMQSQGIKGLSFGVTKNGRLVFAKAYGMADTDKGEELSPTHSMRIMSISKSVTAAGIMKLLEQGNISSLQRKVFGPGSIFGNDYSIPDKNKRLKDITLSQLLHHDAGLRTCNGEPEFWNKNKTYGDVIQMFLNDDNLFLSDPGTDNSYSNTGFFLLAAVILHQ